MGSISLTTIGAKVGYAITSSPMPSTKAERKLFVSSLTYRKIPQCTNVPTTASSPESLENTSFDNLEFKSYQPGLKDLGGEFNIAANLSQDLYDLWEGTNGVMEKWEEAKSTGCMIICINIPGLNVSRYIPVTPSNMDLPELTPNEVVSDTPLPLTQSGEPVWADDPEGDETMVDTTITTYNVTFTGYAEDGVDISVLKNNALVKEFITEDVTTVVKLPNGDYTAIAKKSGSTTQVKDFTVDGAVETVTFSSFA